MCSRLIGIVAEAKGVTSISRHILAYIHVCVADTLSAATQLQVSNIVCGHVRKVFAFQHVFAPQSPQTLGIWLGELPRLELAKSQYFICWPVDRWTGSSPGWQASVYLHGAFDSRYSLRRTGEFKARPVGAQSPSCG
jgi:hypothetical protein